MLNVEVFHSRYWLISINQFFPKNHAQHTDYRVFNVENVLSSSRKTTVSTRNILKLSIDDDDV